ncbi:aspartate-semialdehyde dehydrogenase [Pseudomonas schmalbachii]|uniref:Aspartate-semialdehyde dehydrogenase n=1 Tax=Pseudomonas schmalbachii TaxID=2816993 RepID=A0ABS3TLM1_9PSED|nr:aspartate-semialdehyde dehydrogenase [Pseudomonas schmalbachii]MBO3274552.1 aspartate-semialdehyde dehydrogenase [Pseudomonas schmalbachii]
MAETFDIAVVGATGLQGEALVELLEEREFPIGDLHLLASGDNIGKTLPFRGRNLRVRDVAGFDFSTIRLAFFSVAADVSLEQAPRALAAGCSVIDLSGAFAAGQATLAQVAVNPPAGDLSVPTLFAVPCAPAAELAEVLAALRAHVSFERLVVTACLSASALGREGVQELARQTSELLNARPVEPRLLDRQFAFNMLGQVGEADGEGHVSIERRLVCEVGQLFPELAGRVSASCVLAPVFFGDTLSVTLRSTAPVALDAVRSALDAASGIELVEDDYPTVIGDALGQDVVYVGRVRNGIDDPCELNLWIVSDNVRKGAALNAVGLAESLIKH